MLGRTLSQRERSLLGLAGVAVPLILFWSYVADPFLTEQGSVRERLAQEERALDRARALLTRKEKVATRQAELSDRLELARRQLLPGETPALAAAALQSRLAQAARSAGVSLASQRTEKPVVLGDFLEIPVHVRFQAPIGALAKILKTVEASPLALDIPELSIRLPDPKMPRDLEVEMVVSGFTLAEGARQ